MTTYRDDRLFWLSRARECLRRLNVASPQDVDEAPYHVQAAMREHYGVVSRVIQARDHDAIAALFRRPPQWRVVMPSPSGPHRLLFIDGESEPIHYEDEVGERRAWAHLARAVRCVNRQRWEDA